MVPAAWRRSRSGKRTATWCRSARLPIDSFENRCSGLLLRSTVELGREENRGVLQDLVGPTELFDLLLEVLQLLALVGGEPWPHPVIDLGPSDPDSEGLGRHAQLGADRREGRPFGRVLVPMLSHHPDSAFTHLRGVSIGPWHFSILSREGVRTIPGPIQGPVGVGVRPPSDP